MSRMGLLAVMLVAAWSAAPPAGAQVEGVPAGFTSLFDGKSTAGWHWSRTVHHGTTAVARAVEGVLVLEPHPFGQGGLFLTDRTYKDFEFFVECLPDPAYNSGIFLRSTEGGSAYQIELVRPGNTGALLGEQMRLSAPQYIGERKDINALWKDGQWNSVRVRLTGEAPHITLWINGTQLWEAQLPKNDQIAGAYGGMIGLQLHWSATYTAAAGGRGSGLPWSVQRFRNMAIKELP